MSPMNAPSQAPAAPTRRSGSPVVHSPLAPDPGFIDLLLTLWENRRLMITCLASCLAMGGVVAALWQPTYAYATTMEIGTMQRGADFSLIEPSEAVVAKITNAFHPAIEQAHGLATATPGFTLNLAVKNPRSTGVLILSSKGTEAKQDEHIAIHQQVAGRVLDEHRRLVESMRANLRSDIPEARGLASSVKEASNPLAMRGDLIQKKRELATRRLQEIDEEMTRISANRDQAAKSLTGQDQVLAVMMLDLQMTRERDLRDELQRELIHGFTEKRDALARDEALIANLSETRIVDGPQRSQKPVGIGRAVIMAIALGAGLVIGICLALLIQGLRDRARFGSPAMNS